MAYEIGDDVVMTFKWQRRSDGALIEPTAFQVRLQPPGGQAARLLVAGVDSELAQVAAGHWELTIATDRDNPLDAGWWKGTTSSTGTGKAAQSWQVSVNAPSVGAPSVTP